MTLKQAFEQVHALLIDSLKLGHPQPDAQLLPSVNGSDIAIGAVPCNSQFGVNYSHLVLSEKLSPAESRNSAYGRDIFALFLKVHNFVSTNHKPLTFSLQAKTDRYSREIQRLSHLLADELTSSIWNASQPQKHVTFSSSSQAKSCSLLALQTTPGTTNCAPSTPIPGPLTVFDAKHNILYPGIRAAAKLLAQRFVTRRTFSAISTFDNPEGGGDHIHLGISGLSHASNNNLYPLDFVYGFARWPEATPVSAVSATTVARLSIGVFIHYSRPWFLVRISTLLEID
ncbi:hypothetical protein X801_07903 [Opisthorchis viverrini]|uniref:Reverse transcriptase/retrotransposon-derived protein RNase H-like domain-containing protein n=1 Tax=Opisthorchis viverrini TaxID=6198 RepID=A0A1S8WP84_OPIVI|nr:hypothetical protein X801_07903 [Opisthorchis viverrini]